MGGPGSGRWKISATKSTVGSVYSLDVRDLRRHGLLNPGCRFDLAWPGGDGKPRAAIRVEAREAQLHLAYWAKEAEADWREIEEAVDLATTPCNYGGHQVWFRCPGEDCGRRVTRLYLGGPRFLCRRCYKLAYESQRVDHVNRAKLRSSKIRRRLGGRLDFTAPFPEKPYRMHWHTYNRLRSKGLAAERIVLDRVSAMFDTVNRMASAVIDKMP